MSKAKVESQIGNVPLSSTRISECLERVAGHRLEGFLGGYGKFPGSLMMVGEAPGANEIEKGIPFCGQAGKVLDGYFEALNITRNDLYITSTVRSRPYKDKIIQGKHAAERSSRSNRTPTSYEVFAFAPILDTEIETVQPQIIITLGNIALQRLLGKGYQVSQVHGQARRSHIQQVDADHMDQGYHWSEQEYWIFPMYHPAAVLYNRSLTTIIAEDLVILRELIDLTLQS